MPGWAAALIVAAVLLVIAGIEALVGRAQLKKSTPLIPDRTIDSVPVFAWRFPCAGVSRMRVRIVPSTPAIGNAS